MTIEEWYEDRLPISILDKFKPVFVSECGKEFHGELNSRYKFCMFCGGKIEVKE